MSHLEKKEKTQNNNKKIKHADDAISDIEAIERLTDDQKFALVWMIDRIIHHKDVDHIFESINFHG